MDFACIVLFLAIYHLKPQEWTSLFATIRFAQLTMFASVAALFLRERGLNWRDFLRTPHDWAMLAFFGWVVVASPAPFDTFWDFLNRLVFYVVIVQTLISWDRIKRFLGWWAGMLVAVAALALMGEYFFDPLGSHALTHGPMKGRLVLNLSMVNNPNALGHTIVPVLPMLYYFCIWKRPLFLKEIGLVTFVIPLWCVYLTVSKGAYVAGAATVMATLMFGRPKAIQAILIAVALAVGVTAVQSLPRMNELQTSKTDEAIQGRIRAFTYGRAYYDTLTRGVGQGNFIATVLRDHHYYKSAHSTYVQTGAETGRIGLFLFLLVIWTSARTLLFAKTENPEQERIRRILFVLLFTYCVSGWMVDFAYRASFFMFTAAIAAFHRMLYLRAELSAESETSEEQSPLPWQANSPQPALVPASAAISTTAAMAIGAPPVNMPWLRRDEPEASDEPAVLQPVWNRIGLVDLIVAGGLVFGTELFWSYAIRTF